MTQIYSKDAFAQKSILITGGTSGIGAETGRVFAAGGASVMLAGRNSERGKAVRDEIRNAGGRAEFIQGDVTDSSFSDRAVAETVERFGGLDILFANAGKMGSAPFTEITDQQWQELIATNLTGEFTFGRAAARQMIDQGRGGAIVNMASECGLVAYAGTTTYSVTNGGRITLTKQMATDLAPYRIRVNAVCPGDVDTPMQEVVWSGLSDKPPAEWRELAASGIPMGRITTSEEVAQAVAFLASDAAKQITGSILSVDGGTAASRSLPG